MKLREQRHRPPCDGQMSGVSAIFGRDYDVEITSMCEMVSEPEPPPLGADERLYGVTRRRLAEAPNDDTVLAAHRRTVRIECEDLYVVTARSYRWS
jgi:hypothetical protein